MKKWLKRLSLFSGLALLLGGILFFLGFAISGFNIHALSNVRFAQKHYEERAEQEITSLTLDFDVSDFQIVFDENATGVQIDYPQKQNRRGKNLSVILLTETENSLTVKETKEKFILSPFNFSSPKTTVRLPASRAYDLTIKTDTGDISLQEDGNFSSLALETDTGDITVLGATAQTVRFETDTGDISLIDTQARDLAIDLDTGDLRLENVTVENKLLTETDTGDVTLAKTVKALEISIETDTGDIKARGALVDATTVHLSTDTGDVTATLAGEYAHYAVSVKTHTGDSNIATNLEFTEHTTRSLKIETDTGDIKIYFE